MVEKARINVTIFHKMSTLIFTATFFTREKFQTVFFPSRAATSVAEAAIVACNCYHNVEYFTVRLTLEYARRRRWQSNNGGVLA